jgi:hypothetical protein
LSVRHSVIPAWMTFAAAVDRRLRVILILTGTGCKNDPMVVVDPVTAFRTVAVARGRNGGVAAISLAELSDKVPTTVRAYRNGRLVGQIALNRPVPRYYILSGTGRSEAISSFRLAISQSSVMVRVRRSRSDPHST